MYCYDKKFLLPIDTILQENKTKQTNNIVQYYMYI